MTVVGVAEPAFHGTVVSFDVEVFAPLMMALQIGGSSFTESQDVLSNRRADFLMVLGRLRPGTTLASAGSQMAMLSNQLKRDATLSEVDRDVRVIPIWQSPFGAQTYTLPAGTADGRKAPRTH